MQILVLSTAFLCPSVSRRRMTQTTSLVVQKKTQKLIMQPCYSLLCILIIQWHSTYTLSTAEQHQRRARRDGHLLFSPVCKRPSMCALMAHYMHLHLLLSIRIHTEHGCNPIFLGMSDSLFSPLPPSALVLLFLASRSHAVLFWGLWHKALHRYTPLPQQSH